MYAGSDKGGGLPVSRQLKFSFSVSRLGVNILTPHTHNKR